MLITSQRDGVQPKLTIMAIMLWSKISMVIVQAVVQLTIPILDLEVMAIITIIINIMAIKVKKNIFRIMSFALWSTLIMIFLSLDGCYTVGGPNPGKPCKFPFKWNGKTYSGEAPICFVKKTWLLYFCFVFQDAQLTLNTNLNVGVQQK